MRNREREIVNFWKIEFIYRLKIGGLLISRKRSAIIEGMLNLQQL